ncbi:MAG: hypothetical protein H8M99_04260 [Gloeobacteraceae cyanobacterium ES-bin-144]|nr:hypothetical protein [Verrucomicrobiales bacterium]
MLAQAAGFPLPKPEINKNGFAILPKIEDSLKKLGLNIPPGVHFAAFSNTKIILTGKNATHEELKKKSRQISASWGGANREVSSSSFGT